VPDVDLGLNGLLEVPQVSLQIRFDEMELYMALETKLSTGATYTFNLYTSQSNVGVRVSDSCG